MSEVTALRRTLTLRDLVFAQILVIVGLNSLGPAAKLGSAHWAYWLLGILFFHIPLAIVVTHLSTRMPFEGATYQWAKAAFNERVGFLVAWNLWLFILLFTSTLGLSVVTAAGYAAGADEAWMSDRGIQFAASAVITIALVLLAILGFGTAKWLHNAASIVLLALGVLVVALPFINHSHVPSSPGSLTAMQVVLFTRIAVFALAGLECMSIVIAETRGGARAITKSIAIAVPCIAAAYILGTRSVLAFVPAGQVDLVNPVAQTFSIALGPFGRVAVIAASAAILLLVARDFAQSSQMFSAASRLPLVAGWDHLLPAWITRLHPRWKTPVNAILLAGAVMLASSAFAIVAAGRQEAFQILLSIGGVFFGSTYLVMFAIPLSMRATPWWVRISALSGFVVTAAFVVLSFVPIVEVQSPARYAITIAVAVAATNAIGATIFAARFRNARVTSSSTSERGRKNYGC